MFFDLGELRNRFRPDHAKGIVIHSGETPAHVIRRHWWAFVGPGLASAVVLFFTYWFDEPRLPLVVLVTGWILRARTRNEWSTIYTVLVAAPFVALLVLAGGLSDAWIRGLAFCAVVAYMGHYALEWRIERLVVSDKSLWKVSGLVVTHAPRVPLNRIYFQDVRQNPWDDVLHIGTLFFDTAASADEGIRRFGPVSEPLTVSKAIDEQRSKHRPVPRPASSRWE